jgi:hypothetical protein
MTTSSLEAAAGIFSTGLMTQLLANARNQDDFRFAVGRRYIRLWAMQVESWLLGLSSHSVISQDPLEQWRASVSEANLSKVNAELQSLTGLASKLAAMKGKEAVFDQIGQLHDSASKVTSAITEQEALVLHNAGGSVAQRKKVATALPRKTQAKLALPSSKQDWNEF